MDNDENNETVAADTGDTSGMTEAERLKKEKQREKDRKKKEAKKEKEKEAKEAKKGGDKEKGGAGAKEGEKKKKTPADLIKEQLRKKQEEEEKLRKQEEEEERRLTELERERDEKLQKEKEKKEREKQKKKDKVAQLKKEGKYMTADQKAKLARQREMVEMMAQQGAVVVGPETKEAVQKRPVYGQKKKPGKSAQGENGAESHEPTPEGQTETAAEEEEAEDGGAIAESWEQIEHEKSDEESSSCDEDASSDGDGKDASPTTETPAPVTQPPPTSQIIKEPPPSTPSLPSSHSHQSFAHETKEESRERIGNRIKQRRQTAMANRDFETLRAPVICVLGHVDTGKTKILDKIRRTHVQDGEAGGITQQIGATEVPASAIKEQAKMVKDFEPDLLRLPGYLIIDTPGHESFSNLRSRGSSLCDIAILVVDIMHALEPQTIESLNLLKKRSTPFIVALNKIDRLYEWKHNPHKDIRAVLKSQQPNCQAEFNERVAEVKLKFAEQGVNATLFWENPDPNEYVSLVPTSAITGDGMGNLIAALAQHSQTHLKERLAFCDDVKCTILEVKVLTGLGTTLDVILVDGTLHVGDTIVVPGTDGAIVTQIRGLLMPAPLKELRVKNDYKNYDEVKGAQGIKITAKDMEKALAGLPLMVAKSEDEIDYLKDEVEKQLDKVLKSFALCDRGVYVQASTLGALEALLTFLRDQKIPYCGINIGPVHKRDVIKTSTMLEHDSQWAVILAFDVKVDRDAQQMADEQGIRIFTADIIYHLEDAYMKFREEWKQKKRQEHAHLAIFPVKLRVLPQHIFNSRDPLVMGVIVEDGIAKIGTPICVPTKEGILLGTISSLEVNHKPADGARKGQELCVKIENTTGDAPKMYGRHFDYQDMLVSRITRESIDVMKTYFRDDLQKNDWQLIVELKKSLGIM